MSIKDRIQALLEEKGELSVKEMTGLMGVSKQGIHFALKQLLGSGEIEKFGRVPLTFYRMAEPEEVRDPKEIYLSKSDEEYLFRHFLLITELGELQVGVKGFVRWCKKRDLPPEKTIEEFIRTREKYLRYYSRMGVIDGMSKLNNTLEFEGIFLDQLLYLDFYAIERFGKSRLGTLLHFAKQAQNKFLMNKLTAEIKPPIEGLLSEMDFDAVAFVPPTIPRKIQIMNFLETHLAIPLPTVPILKVSGKIPVPQKSLSRIDERINNAEKTFAVTGGVRYKHLLLIDDAAGSGATMNQIAGKLKRKGIAQKVTGLAIVGSFKGFDVISDV